MGKTCLAKLFVEREILQHSTNTIGFDHHVREVEIDNDVTVKVSYVQQQLQLHNFISL